MASQLAHAPSLAPTRARIQFARQQRMKAVCGTYGGGQYGEMGSQQSKSYYIANVV